MLILFTKRRFLWLVATVLVIYALSRLVNLDILPIFTDEAIYIRWSQIGSRDANWRFISLTDGKQPLFTWVMMVFLRILPLDPLIVGRLVSVLAGLFTLIGIIFVSLSLFQLPWAAIISGLLYIISPFTLLYDRMALYDSMVSMFFIWSLYLSIRLVKTPRLDLALILAMLYGGGILNKSSGFLSMLMLPVLTIIYDRAKTVSQNRTKILRFGIFGLLSILLSYIYYSVLRLSPFFHMIGLKNSVFVYSFSEWLTHPFSFLYGNLRGLLDWLLGYLTVPVIILILIGLFTRQHIRQKLLLFLFWLVPFMVLALFGKVLYPRFILFMTIPLFIIAGYGFYLILKITSSYLYKIVIVTISILPSLWISYFLIINPFKALIPLADKGQLIDDWPAGGGVKQIVSILSQYAYKGKIAVFTDGTFGLMPYALEIYLVDNQNIELKGIWPLPVNLSLEMIQKSRQMPTFIVLNQAQNPPPLWTLKLINTFQKGNRPDVAMRLYQVIPPATTEPVEK